MTAIQSTTINTVRTAQQAHAFGFGDKPMSPVAAGEAARQDAQIRSGGHSAPTATEAVTAATPKTIKGAKTIADFKLVGATAQDRKDFSAMLSYLQGVKADGSAQSPTAVALLKKLPAGQKIVITHDHDDSFWPGKNEIHWDPRSALIVSGTQNKQSPALGFIHEVDHAVAGQKNPKPTGDGYDNTEEKRVITGSETRIAHDLGEPTRTDHHGSVEHVSGPTVHTAITYGGGGGGSAMLMQ